ncbi:MAG: DUF1642 domain-containing protein [Bacillota bacterium]
MNEKVKLPKFMCVWLEARQLATSYPISLIGNIDTVRANNDDVAKWLAFNKSNQWKLIDALRYGYEAEPKPRWAIKVGNCYMIDSCLWRFANVTPELVIDCEADFDEKYEADEVVNKLGFGEVVDLNKEGKAYDYTE